MKLIYAGVSVCVAVCRVQSRMMDTEAEQVQFSVFILTKWDDEAGSPGNKQIHRNMTE